MGCIIEKNQNYKILIKNSSGFDIEIFYFKNGIIDSNKTIILKNTNEATIDSGIILRGSFSSDFDETTDFLSDSALVVFDKKYSKIHYLFLDSVYSTNNAAPVNRNIFNFSNYLRTDIDKNNTYYIYTFTEQDYIDTQ
jgi:hypothetical protein